MSSVRALSITTFRACLHIGEVNPGLQVYFNDFSVVEAHESEGERSRVEALI